MASKKKTYICTHDLTIDSKVVKAGESIKASQLCKETIEQYIAGGILSEVIETPEAPTEE